MQRTGSFAIRLTARLEIYINLIVVPLAVYFAFTAGDYRLDEMIVFGVVAGISATVMMIIGTIVRIILLSRIEKEVDDPSVEPVQVKLRILRYPRVEYIIVSLRWFFGIILCYVLLTFFTPLNLWRTITFFLAAVLCPIVNGTINYFTTENLLKLLLEMPRMAETAVPPGSYRTLGIARRLMMAVFAVAAIPIIIMGYLLYLTNAQLVRFSGFTGHMVIIIALSAATMAVLIYEASRGMRRGLQRTIDTLGSLERGEYDIHSIPLFDRSEIGTIGYYVNVLARSLREFERRNIELNRELTELNAGLSRDAAALSRNTNEQAAAMEEIVSTTEEIAAGADSVVRAMDDQFAAMASLIKSMGDLSSAIESVTGGINRVLSLARNIEDTTKTGGSTLAAMLESMKKVSESSAQMTSIIEIINDISDKINLLSLNASIEAARAGEAGRGFAVVADEVSKLADMTANSIKDISSLVRASIDEIRTGMTRIDETASTIGGISGLVESINASVREISGQMKNEELINILVNEQAELIRKKSEIVQTAMKEQKDAIDEIVKTITIINHTLQGTVDAAADLSRSASKAESIAASLMVKQVER